MRWRLLFIIALAIRAEGGEGVVPDFRINPHDCTVLMAVDAKLALGLKPFQPGTHGKVHLVGWTRPEQALEWEVLVPQEDDYVVLVLLQRHGKQPLVVEVWRAGQELSGMISAAEPDWQRVSLDGALRLPAGRQTLALQAHAPDGTNDFGASVLSVELLRPAGREQLHRSALSLRADTRWLQECRYGLMCHWTSQSFSRCGERKP